MTRDEKLSILDAAAARAYAAVSKTDGEDLKGESFSHLLNSLSTLEYLEARLSSECGGDCHPDCAAQSETADPTPEPEPKPAEEASDTEQQATLTKEQVKAKLLELSSQYDELDVAAVMEGIGYSRLSDVPPAKYELLLNKAAEAVKELS